MAHAFCLAYHCMHVVSHCYLQNGLAVNHQSLCHAAAGKCRHTAMAVNRARVDNEAFRVAHCVGEQFLDCTAALCWLPWLDVYTCCHFVLNRLCVYCLLSLSGCFEHAKSMGRVGGVWSMHLCRVTDSQYVYFLFICLRQQMLGGGRAVALLLCVVAAAARCLASLLRPCSCGCSVVEQGSSQASRPLQMLHTTLLCRVACTVQTKCCERAVGSGMRGCP
jgi:hypothetical protein